MNSIVTTTARTRAYSRSCAFGIFCSSALLIVGALRSSAVPMVATNGTSLARFDSELPGTVTTVQISGLRAGDSIVGIDTRPADGKLYGVSESGAVFVLDATTGEATPVGPGFSFALNGAAFGTDFNPVVDRIRQVSNTEQNLRLNPNNGALAGTDTPLNTAGNVVAVGYTNNFVGAMSTTLYGIDSAAGQLVRIGSPDGSPDSPNTGNVTVIGSMGLGINLSQNIGFDIFSNSSAFAAITVAGQTRLYSVSLTNGAASNLGAIGSGTTSYHGLAVVLQPPVPAVAYGVTANGVLFRFVTTSPSSVTTIGNLGLTPEAIDFRPGTQQLYAINVGPQTTQLYTVNLTTAQVTPVGAGFPSQVSGQPSNNYNLTASTIGFDFNPRTLQADGSLRIRVVSNNGANLRINSATGQIAVVDTPLSIPPGDPNSPGMPAVDAVAYINSAFATGPVLGSTTTLYDLDHGKDDLFIQNPPNDGVLNTVGQSGLAFDQSVSFDIYTDPDSTDNSVAGDHGFAVLRRQGETTHLLHDVDLATGLIINGRVVGGGLDFVGGLAIQPSAGKFRLSAASYSVAEGAGAATITVERVNGSVGAASVAVNTTPGTASAGLDYINGSTTLNFADGETTKTLNVAINDDLAVEGDETINVQLGSTTGGAFTTAPLSAVLTIVDNDLPAIAVAFQTNGTDNETAPGLAVRVGSLVRFSYAVANTGNVPLGDISVRDDNGTPADAADDFVPTFINGDGNGNNFLDVGETWMFTAALTATAGQFNHVATVSALPVGGGAPVTASNPEFYRGVILTALANISTRLRVETGERVLIGGFIISGTEPKRLITRAIGPSLGFGEALQDPAIEIYNSEGVLIAENNNWQDAPNRQEIIDSTIPPANDLEAAFLGSLNPGAYTAIVFGVGETSGIGLVEVYDLNQTANADLANIATRGFVQTGDNALIGGLIITGNEPLNVLLRGIGPSLAIDGKLADPTLELFNANGDTIATNDNWRDEQQAEIEATGIPPNDDLESAILATLPPAPYTAVVRGVNGGIGVGLVEVYALD